MDQLAGVDGVEILTPAEQRAAIVAFRVAGWEAERVRDELGRRVFAICGVVDAPGGSAIRLSVGCWNSDEELDRSVAAVRELAAHTPETLPRRPGLVILPWGGEGA
jgi:selenocysteine lyase/cysteine desulfurase